MSKPSCILHLAAKCSIWFVNSYRLVHFIRTKLKNHLNVFRCFPLMMSGISENNNTGWKRIFWLWMWESTIWVHKKTSPNPTPSYSALSRSTVCLMTASLAPWRRPWRPLIPFTNSICSSSESNLWRYLNPSQEHNSCQRFLHFRHWKSHRMRQLQNIQAQSGSQACINRLLWDHFVFIY